MPSLPVSIYLGVEILAPEIRKDNKVEGIKLFQTEHKVSQFADDTTLSILGLSLNVEKTKAIWLGPWRFNNSKPLDQSGQLIQ